jgi:hypothetical protein
MFESPYVRITLVVYHPRVDRGIELFLQEETYHPPINHLLGRFLNRPCQICLHKSQFTIFPRRGPHNEPPGPEQRTGESETMYGENITGSLGLGSEICSFSQRIRLPCID